jgi:hypothetical protein
VSLAAAAKASPLVRFCLSHCNTRTELHARLNTLASILLLRQFLSRVHSIRSQPLL